jgi:hypothetical protein
MGYFLAPDDEFFIKMAYDAKRFGQIADDKIVSGTTTCRR